MSYDKLSSPTGSFTTLPKSEDKQEVVSDTDAIADAEKMANLGLLLAGLAHEINNPASFVHNSALNLRHRMESFQEFLLSLSDEQDSEFNSLLREKLSPMLSSIDTIAHGVERILNIVSNVQLFQRKQYQSSPELGQIGDGLRKTIALVQPTYKDKIDFDYDLKDDPHILGWHLQLHQAFLNLAVNACQAMQNKAKEEEGYQGSLHVKSQVVGTQLQVIFTDNGPGISPELQAEIFEPFFSTKAPGEGTGLGLTISHEIIERHGGLLELESEVGKGTTFTVSLPLPQ